MNLQEQIGALETGVDQLNQLIQVTLAPKATATAETASEAAAEVAVGAATSSSEPAEPATPVVGEKPTLGIARPAQNEITMTIGGQTVSLHPEQVGQLIEELANARASMMPEPPGGLPTGWRFVSTKNPVMAAQKQSNGDRLLVLRHTGHGWVPFTFSPEMVVQMYALLTQR
ncbi:hypothetical protein [Paraburkholderia sartisoli]|uniref:Phage tail protein n=1 Tax=Paraburkholderia sartisoli TaxID=83784 RepID=A0A1H4GQG3_9BURK|nr:hypothetical protein [Paraburkholderia sartisoli]SEB11088.1 hypothetical protein SAMN05192564_106191 [Paraburkholderia sartisoli]